MEIEFRLPGPDDPFGPPKARPEDLGPDDLGNRGVLRAGLEEQGRQLRAEFAELEATRAKAEEEIELERAGVDLTLEGVRLSGLPEEDDGEQPGDPLKAFSDFARERIAALPEGAREDAALHAGHERLRLDRAWRRRRHNTRVKRLQAGVDRSLDALTAQAGHEPERLAELAERGFGLLQATGEGLRFDESQNKTLRGRFGRSLAEAALRAMAPKQALSALESGAIEALLPDAAVRETLRSELTAAAARERRALKAETAGLMTLHLAQLDRGEPGVPEIDRDVEIDFGADEARAFTEQAEAARQRDRLRRQWRLAPEREIADGLEQAEATGDPTAARTVAEEIRDKRRRDPAAAVAEDPKLQALLAVAEDDPAQRGLAASVGLELQKELGIPEGDRRVLTRQELADLTAQIEAAPPVQRAALLQQVKQSFGAHYDRVLSELEDARLDPITLALARRLDDPIAARRLGALQGKTRAALTEGLDPAETATVAVAARAAVPGPLAPAAERLALARYQQSGDRDDAVAVARETVGGSGSDTLTGGGGDDRTTRDPTEALRDDARMDEAIAALETLLEDPESDPDFSAANVDGTVLLGDFTLAPDVAERLLEALTLTEEGAEAFFQSVIDLEGLTGEQRAALIGLGDQARRGRLDIGTLSADGKRDLFRDLFSRLDKTLAARRADTEGFIEAFASDLLGGRGFKLLEKLGAKQGGRVRGSPDANNRTGKQPRNQGKPPGQAPSRPAGPARRDDFETQDGWEIFQARRKSGIPLGMSTKDQVSDLTKGLDAALAQAGLPTGKIALRGSAVTEHKFNKATNKYSGQRTIAPSDYDIAIVSSELMEIARERGIKMMPNGRRSVALKPRDLRKLGLLDSINALTAELKAPDLTIMIYRDEDSLLRRGAMMWLKEKMTK